MQPQGMGMGTGALPPSNDDRVMWDIWESMFTLPLVTVADEVGTFGALAEAQLTTEELAAKLKVDARALGIHLAGLGAMGLLDKRGESQVDSLYVDFFDRPQRGDVGSDRRAYVMQRRIVQLPQHGIRIA